MSDQGSQPTPGWYYAAGDPPGTQRYWDGSAWQGGPQPVGGGIGGVAAGSTGGTPAEPGQRFIAFLIDFAIAIGISIVVTILGGISDALGLIGNLGYLAFIIYNYIYLQGTTGSTIGKQQQNIKLLSDDTGAPVGMGMAFVRGLVQSVLAILCFIPLLVDYVFILTDKDNRRFSDKFLKMQVKKA